MINRSSWIMLVAVLATQYIDNASATGKDYKQKVTEVMQRSAAVVNGIYTEEENKMKGLIDEIGNEEILKNFDEFVMARFNHHNNIYYKEAGEQQTGCFKRPFVELFAYLRNETRIGRAFFKKKGASRKEIEFKEKLKRNKNKVTKDMAAYRVKNAIEKYYYAQAAGSDEQKKAKRLMDGFNAYCEDEKIRDRSERTLRQQKREQENKKFWEESEHKRENTNKKKRRGFMSRFKKQ